MLSRRTAFCLPLASSTGTCGREAQTNNSSISVRSSCAQRTRRRRLKSMPRSHSPVMWRVCFTRCRDAVRDDSRRVGGRRRRKRECAGRRAHHSGSSAPGLGVHGTEVLELPDRSVVAVLKHRWLFLHSLDSVATVRQLVAFYVQEHNRVLPHSAFRGQTLDEMYFGRGDAVPADVTVRAAAARRARIEANRSAACGRCPSIHAAA